MSKKGVEKARNAKYPKKTSFTFNIAFTSLLKKAVKTLWIVLDEMNLMWIPVKKSETK